MSFCLFVQLNLGRKTEAQVFRSAGEGSRPPPPAPARMQILR